MFDLARRITEHRWFSALIIGLILLGALIIGIETSTTMTARFGGLLTLINNLILVVFVAEVVLKLLAAWPRPQRYFTDGWNLFDFTIVVLSLVPATGQFAMVARLGRLLRVMRLVSTVPELRLIVSTLVRSLPSMGHVIVLMSVLFYIYGVAGYHLFHAHDPIHWGTLGLSLLTLFRIVTLEDWTDVMYKAMELEGLSWIFFVSFVVLGTFVVINLFIAVVLNNLDEAKREQLEALKPAPSKEALIDELRETRAALEKLEHKLKDW